VVSCPGHGTLRERDSNINWTGDWMSQSTDLDVVAKRKSP